jgi:drug/metabolite transporter (DMT)-like permease
VEASGPRSHRYGVILVAAAAVLWSTAGVFVRWIELDVWTVLGWRSLFAALSLAVVIGLRNRMKIIEVVRAMGVPGLAAIPVAVVTMSTFVIALKLTTVANVMFVYATLPFVAAAIAFAWIGERPRPQVLAASGIALIGVAIVAGAAPRPQDIAGNAIALLMTIAFAVQLVMARRYPRLDMAPVNAAAAAICAVLCWPLVSTGIPDARQLLLLALFGITTVSLAYLLFLVGGRHIASSEAGLIGLLDVVLAPAWVWLLFAEQPGRATLLGGSLIVAAVFWYLFGQRRRNSRG